jgi:exodeoxyribonuclease VII small subunit
VPRLTKPTGSETRDEALPFEEALKKLETIVETMETDELPLETLLTQFEEGTRLARSCQARLAEAELKIQQLEQTSAGDLVLNPAPVVDSSAAS